MSGVLILLDDDVARYADQTTGFEYTCFEEVDDIARALLSRTTIGKTLVERPEYHLLCRMMENSDSPAFLITGHPGIGLSGCSCSVAIPDFLFREDHLSFIPSSASSSAPSSNGNST